MTQIMKKVMVWVLLLVVLSLQVVADAPPIIGTIESGCDSSVLPCAGTGTGGSLVRDGTAPQVGLEFVSNQVVKGTASDVVGVTEVKLFYKDYDGLIERREISPPQTSLVIDFDLVALGVTLQIGDSIIWEALDAEGNKGTITRTLASQPPAGTGLSVSILSPADNTPAFGIITIQARATDDKGIARFELIVDGVPRPSSASGGLVTGSVVDVGDVPSGCPEYLCPGGGTSSPVSQDHSFQLDTTTLTNGPHTITVKAVDTDGNEATSSPIAINVQNEDTTPPTVSITSPTEMDRPITGKVTVTVNALDTGGSGIQKVEFYDSVGLKFTDLDSPYSFDFDFTPGQQPIKVIAYDKATPTPNQAQAERTITVVAATVQDMMAPTVQIMSPLDQAKVVGPQETVTANPLDDVGVTKVEFFVDDVPQPVVTQAPYSFIWSPTGATGPRVIKAVAYDAAGKTGEHKITVQFESVTPPSPPPSGGGGSTSSGGGGSDSRVYRNELQTRGVKRDTDIVAEKIQPIFQSPIANPVVPAPRTAEPIRPIELTLPFEPLPIIEETREPVKLWVIIVTSVGLLLLLAGVVVLLHKRRVPQDIIEYVRSNIAQGYEPEVLEESLLQQGWSSSVVQRAVIAAQKV